MRPSDTERCERQSQSNRQTISHVMLGWRKATSQMAQEGSRTFIINQITKNLFLPEHRKTFQHGEDMFEKGHAPLVTHAAFTILESLEEIVPGGLG